MPRTRLLLVEDDPGHQELLLRALLESAPDLDVKIADTGRAAFQIVRDDHEGGFDCIVSDYHLPDVSASELLPWLSGQGADCPMLVLSSSTDQSVTIESFRSGSVDFVTKSEALEDGMLWERAHRAMEEHGKQEQSRRRMQRRVEQLARLSEQDCLTGLANRRSLEQRLNDTRSTLDRRGMTAYAMIDVDHFKEINDTYGHPFGDTVLRAIGEAIKAHTVDQDLACRYGGEEFLVIRADTTQADAFVWAERLRHEIEKLSFSCGNESVRATISIGLAVCPSVSQMKWCIERADAAVYHSKRSGRNRVSAADMVDFEEALRIMNATYPNASLDEKLQRLVREKLMTLGPTQQEHVMRHSLRVAELAERLGRTLRLGPTLCDKLRVAGRCHDIGKIVISEQVLAKNSSLSSDERLLVNRHAADGAEMAVMLGADRQTADLVRFHHVYYDKAKDVEVGGARPSLGSNVLAVADAIVTMTADQPYRPARSLSSAILEVQRYSGVQFDPEVVAATPRALVERAKSRRDSSASLELANV